MKELTQSFLTKEKLNQDMENPEKRLVNIDSFLPDSFKKRKGGQRMWRDTIIVEEDNRIVATGDNAVEYQGDSRPFHYHDSKREPCREAGIEVGCIERL